MADTPLKLAVFVDFDNIEIGVKATLNQSFDIGVVLEALKERGEVVSKTAYSDWKRAGDYSRALSQHAVKMVQRTLTPGGDKNGADINLALDALEMAFTHSHINTFVIVGGDSDFITLVEKLKQYDKKVFVVGGRQFTSVIMQKNCHEFIAYENLVGQARRHETRGRPAAAASQQPIEQAVPLVRRALKLLSEREVSPQLGLLKSTLLQLDSTFSERSYGASTFLDFAEKLAAAGVVGIRRSGHNLAVDLIAGGGGRPERVDHPAPHAATADEGETDAGAASEETGPPPAGDRGSLADGLREVRRLFLLAPTPPRWPMYLRHVKQFLRAIDPTFDERRYGFSGLNELVRACQKDGLFRLERGRQGVLRVFGGAALQAGAAMPRVAEEHAAIADERETATIESDQMPDAMIAPPAVDDLQAAAEPTAQPAAETPKRRRRRTTGEGDAAGRRPAVRRPRKVREDA
jgi:uncharacterized LabA/DUF88 family protein